MKKSTVIFLLWVIFSFTSSLLSSVDDLYWLVFRAVKNKAQKQVFPIYLIQINSFGDVQMQPVEILQPMRFVFGDIAFGLKSQREFNFWLLKSEHRHGPNTFFNRAAVDVRTLSTQWIHQLDFQPFESTFLSITNRKQNNFMLARNFDALVGVGLNQAGGFSGRTWPVSPSPSEDLYRISGAVSDDGAILMLATNKGLFYQPLNPEGVPIRKPVLVQKDTRYLSSVTTDISNPLSNGTRAVADYRECVSYSCHGLSKLELFTIDAKGSRVGETSTLISSDYNEDPPTDLWMEPQGRFLIYIRSTYQEHSTLQYNVIFFQALDATGHPSDKPKPIIDNVEFFDLVKN